MTYFVDVLHNPVDNARLSTIHPIALNTYLSILFFPPTFYHEKSQTYKKGEKIVWEAPMIYSLDSKIVNIQLHFCCNTYIPLSINPFYFLMHFESIFFFK